MDGLTYYGLIALLIFAIALQLLRAWCEHRDSQPDDDPHESTDDCRN